jgi:porphobilinogen synthase
MRRLRQSESLRHLARNVHLDISKLVLPLFIHHGTGVKNPIASMQGHYQLSIDMLEQELETIVNLGIKTVLLFGIPEKKDALGSDSCSDHGIIQSAIPVIKQLAPSLLVISDVCFCEYTTHGHCGVVADADKEGRVDNDKTLALLG